MENEVCENCSRAIGKLEQAFVYKGHVVCKQCNKYMRDEPQRIPSAPAKNVSSKVIRVIGAFSIAVIILIFLSIFIVRGKLPALNSGSPLRGMTAAEVQQLVRDWRAGSLPGMDLATKEQRDKLAEAESKLNEIAKREYEPWNAQQPAAAQGGAYSTVTDRGARYYAEMLIEFGAASDLLIAQLEIVNKLEEEIPAGPSFEAWQKYKARVRASSLTKELGYYCSAQRGVDRSRAMFYKIFGEPNKKQLLPGEYRFYYYCKDGVVELILPQFCFDYDCVTIPPSYIRVY